MKRQRNQTAAFHVEYCRLRPEHQIPAHSQDTWELTWIQHGSGERTVGGVMRPFAPGDIALVPPHVTHRWRFDPRSSAEDGNIANIAIFIPPDMMRSFCRLPEVGRPLAAVVKADMPRFLHGESADRAARPMQKALDSAMPLQVALTIEALAVVAMATDNDCDTGARELDDNERLRERLRVFVACNLHRRIPLAEIARIAGLSRSAFCARSRELIGGTFVDYLNKMRMEEAGRQLRSGGATIADIAASCGFDDASYFNRVFRRLTGTTPSAYRSRASSS